jgi:hypothetical protein
MTLLARIKRELAKRRLQALVDQQRNSYETRRYRERREASKLGWQRRKGLAR